MPSLGFRSMLDNHPKREKPTRPNTAHRVVGIRALTCAGIWQLVRFPFRDLGTDRARRILAVRPAPSSESVRYFERTRDLPDYRTCRVDLPAALNRG